MIIVFVLGFLVFSYFGSSSVALSVAGAREVTGDEDRELTRLVENLSIGSGLPMPKVYVIEDMSMNAFATGRDPKHASVAVTRGLMNRLDRRELEGVLAHEMSHIGNRDTLVMTVVVVLLGVLALLADLGLRLTWYGAGSRRSYGDKNSKGQGHHHRRRHRLPHPVADHRAPDQLRRLAASASTSPTPRARCSRATRMPSHAPSRRSAWTPTRSTRRPRRRSTSTSSTR